MSKKRFFISILFLFLLLIIYIFENLIGDKFSILFLIVLIVGFGILIFKKNKLKYKEKAYLILILGIIFRLFYIINYSYIEIQHDLGTINSKEHLDYIYTIYKTGHLPTSNIGEFYHPPLFHSLGALFLKITSIFSFNDSRHFESLQYLTFIISVISLLFIYKLINKIKIDNKYKVLALLIFNFFPLSIIMSGSINNDTLMIMNFIISIYYLFEWYEDPSTKNTILLALFAGLCVSSKMNGALIAIPILYIFLMKIVESKESIGYYIKKSMLFGIISLPIGLWYPIRNYVLFKQNLFYVLSDGLEKLYVGNHSIIQRFLSFSFDQYIHIFAQPHGGDYNIWAYLIKTSLFDETILSGNFIHVLLFFVHSLLIIIFTYYVLKSCISKKKNIYINTFLITCLFVFISFLIFNIKYPYSCSMHFRYIYITFILIVTTAFYEISLSKNKNIYNIVRNLVSLFVFLSIIMVYCHFN